MTKTQKEEIVEAAKQVLDSFANTAQEHLDSKQCDALEKLENAIYLKTK